MIQDVTSGRVGNDIALKVRLCLSVLDKAFLVHFGVFLNMRAGDDIEGA
jgi:hypothetical protein